jgi:histidine ammonia-lyase
MRRPEVRLALEGTVELGHSPLSIEAVWRVACERAPLALAPAAVQRMNDNHAVLLAQLAKGVAVYGVTTGFGDSCGTEISAQDRAELALNLVRFHGCGVGPLLSETECRAVVVARLACLVRAHSGVRSLIAERLIGMLNCGIVAAIPALGSVGASGDLTPLSYVAATLVAEREVYAAGSLTQAATALQAMGLAQLTLEPKESLALMNGTSAMTGLACLAFERARRLTRWCAALTALYCDAIQGRVAQFDRNLFELKAHPGQQLAAAWIEDDACANVRPAHAIQDRYSLRCAPHVIGVCVDTLSWTRTWLETELNSVNDNPVLVGEELYHGGHFYGGHVCQAMDSLKTTLANLVDLLDRQLVAVCDPRSNRELPANLVASRQRGPHHGFKAMQIAASALAAETAKLAVPASVFSRSTENHNQDKVSLGTIAARDCLAVLELGETTAAIATLTLVQAVSLRAETDWGPRARALHAAVRAAVPAPSGDQRMDEQIKWVLGLHRSGQLPIGALP